jgi:hypothetical protein
VHTQHRSLSSEDNIKLGLPSSETSHRAKVIQCFSNITLYTPINKNLNYLIIPR